MTIKKRIDTSLYPVSDRRVNTMKFCKYPTCTEWVIDKYCDNHKPSICLYPECSKETFDITGLCNRHKIKMLRIVLKGLTTFNQLKDNRKIAGYDGTTINEIKELEGN